MRYASQIRQNALYAPSLPFMVSGLPLICKAIQSVLGVLKCVRRFFDPFSTSTHSHIIHSQRMLCQQNLQCHTHTLQRKQIFEMFDLHIFVFSLNISIFSLYV